MSLVPQGPLRVLLATLAVSLFGLSLLQGSPPLTLSAGIGAAALLGLAARGSRWTLRYAHYLLALALALPWIDGAGTGPSFRLALALLALALWANMGLRRPKHTRPSPQSWRQTFALLGLSCLWLALGFMGGALSSLLWNPSATSGSLAPNLLFGAILVTFRHGQFYLQPKSDSHP